MEDRKDVFGFQGKRKMVQLNINAIFKFRGEKI